MQLAVFVVEDNAEIQENLVGALEELTCVKVVGGSATEEDALGWIAARNHWDMLIVDLFLKGGSGMRLVQRVQRARPEQKIIVFSNYVNASVRKRCAQLGVDAVFDKSTEIDTLVDYCSHQCNQMGASQSAPMPLYPSGGPL
ncbi:response regulator [Ramlibacter sp.]|uniref:response regulator n=1 Tax=Ramlibacter sp. TaxID=1917967 RepID=UPI0026193945|nr:response regulator [Ramlibacter sp.]MDB5956567.1 putative response regulator, CheY [Ramlibacter sp.]